MIIRSLHIHHWLLTRWRPHVLLGGLITRHADACWVRAAYVHTSVMDVMAGFAHGFNEMDPPLYGAVVIGVRSGYVCFFPKRIYLLTNGVSL